MSKLIWLSFPLAPGDPRPPAIPAPELTPLYTVAKDGASVHILRVASHTGTHVDAPRHVIRNGVAITDYAPAELVFTRPVVVPLKLGDDQVVQPDHLRPALARLKRADMILFKFGYGRIRTAQPARFSQHAPGFGVAAARCLRAACPALRAIGLDVPSLACIAHLNETMAAHNELLGGRGNRRLVIEDMKLDGNLRRLREVRLAPWLVRGMDSAPCSVVGVIG